MPANKVLVVLGSAFLLCQGSVAAHAAGLWDKFQASGVIRCGAIPASTPGSFEVPGPEKFEGYVINHCRQIARDLSTAMGKEIKPQFVQTTWSTVVLDLQADRLDIWPGMSDTPERRKAIDMAGPLYDVSFCLINKKGLTGLQSWDDYNKANIRIATITGTTDEKAAKEYVPNAQHLSFRDFSEAILAVQAGRADAFVNSALSCLDILNKNPTIFGEMVIPTPARGLPSSAGLAKDQDKRFSQWLENWAKESRASGKTRELFLDALKKANIDTSTLPKGFNF